ncbi:MAG: ribosome biogenesis GTPase Der [Clostridia bacterium]|nr:ribosome biogenesis GTPase Der [Clostridia bacterium]
MRPLVAVVGRPNVGKSTFFNKVCGKRISIVDDIAGVTRDRIYGDAEWCGHYFTLVDTGGLDFEEQGEIQQNIFAQAQIAIDLADVILLFVDGKTGMTNADRQVAEYLRKSKKNIIVVVNKLDNFEVENSYDFYELGFKDVFAISAEQSKGLGDLLDQVVVYLKNSSKTTEEPKEVVKIAIVGKPNAGKSSLTNRLLGEDRLVVSSIAGTTRDAIDTPFRYNNKDYVLIDTAGMRKKNAIEDSSIERYSVLRSIEAIKRADVVLIVIDVASGITEQDVKVAGFVHEQKKPSVIVLNKWDLVEKDDKTINTYTNKLKEDLKFMDYFVPVFISAKTSQRTNKIMPLVEMVLENASKRIKTGVLNEIIQNAINMKQPPSKNGQRLKILYATQASTNPPNIVVFVNDKSAMHFSYERYLENCIRDAVDFQGTPIQLTIKNRSEKEDL